MMKGHWVVYELLRQQFKPNWFEMNLLAQRLFRLTENLVVVESQRRHFVKGKPSRVGRIVAPLIVPCVPQV